MNRPIRRLQPTVAARDARRPWVNRDRQADKVIVVPVAQDGHLRINLHTVCSGPMAMWLPMPQPSIEPGGSRFSPLTLASHSPCRPHPAEESRRAGRS
jgi:hypothetical protein